VGSGTCVRTTDISDAAERGGQEWESGGGKGGARPATTARRRSGGECGAASSSARATAADTLSPAVERRHDRPSPPGPDYLPPRRSIRSPAAHSLRQPPLVFAFGTP